MQRFRNILFVADPLAEDPPALARALVTAQRHQARFKVILVEEAVAAPGVEALADAIALARQRQREAHLRQLEGVVRGALPDAEFVTAEGRAFIEIIREVQGAQHDLLIKPAEHESLGSRLFGSTDMHLLRKCPCPVWLLRPSAEGAIRRVLAAVDFDPYQQAPDPLALEVLESAAAVALAESSELHVVHAWDAPAEGTLRVWGNTGSESIANYVRAQQRLHAAGLAAHVAALKERLGPESLAYLAPIIHLPRGSARDAIVDLVDDLAAELVVMGTLGRSGIPGMLIGNTAESVLARIGCSVLALKPAGFTSPVA